jgi:oligopeptide/dipeptide ABC transporter ATP-binding protein
MARLLEVADLSVSFPGQGAARVRVVDGIALGIAAGETLALVGESGCGKSVTALAVLRLIAKPGRIEPGSRILFGGRDVLALSVPRMRALRGAEIGMVFQEPQTSLNPVVRVGAQVAEAIQLHTRTTSTGARKQVIELFARVGIPDPTRRFDLYPHQLSGGLKQRVMIAMAVALRPRLLIADEPTTALDATIRAQVLALLRDLSASTRMAVLLITHDFGVVNEVADRIAVMYAGQVVEEGTRTELLAEPRHPYTQGLLGAIPTAAARGRRLEEIKGTLPRAGSWPAGCPFHPRCRLAFEPCPLVAPRRIELSPTHYAACHFVEREVAR